MTPSAGSEERFERGFRAYLRGDRLEALLLWEEAFLVDPTHEQALTNYSRLSAMLGAPGGATNRVRSLVRRAKAVSPRPGGKDSPGAS